MLGLRFERSNYYENSEVAVWDKACLNAFLNDSSLF